VPGKDYPAEGLKEERCQQKKQQKRTENKKKMGKKKEIKDDGEKNKLNNKDIQRFS